jgi:predicted amidohydrolase
VSWYDKHTLSSLDSRHFVPGDELSVYAVNDVTAGVQICWELLFPRQWAQLKREGAQVVFHVNNAVKREDAFWEHVLLTRAFENRYFVCSVNNAATTQTLPSYVIAPSGDPAPDMRAANRAGARLRDRPVPGGADMVVNGWRGDAGMIIAASSCEVPKLCSELRIHAELQAEPDAEGPRGPIRRSFFSIC